MAKNKKSWLARLEEADRKAQARLDADNSPGIKTVFRKSNARARKPTKREETLRITKLVYSFFIFEICVIGSLLVATSGILELDYTTSLSLGFQLLFWLAILTVTGIIIGIVALAKRPRTYYMHIPLICNLLLVIYAFMKLFSS